MKTQHNILTILAILLLNTHSFAQTWTSYTIGSGYNLFQIDCASPDIAYVAGKLYNIQKTVNGGATWTNCYIGGGSFDNSTVVEVIDANTVYASLEGYHLYKSTDGGATWVQKINNTGAFVDMFFLSGTTGFGVGVGSLTKTTNSYNTYTSLSSQISAGSWRAIDLNGNLGVIAGLSGRFAISTNGGNNWSSFQFSSQINLWDVSVNSATKIYLVGSNGTILYSDNSGSNFSQYTSLPATTESYYSIAFDENYTNGFIVGTNGTIIKTTNGGTTWTEESTSISANLFDISYAGNGVFYACGSNCTVIKYTPAQPTSIETISENEVDFCLYPNPALESVKLTIPVETNILTAFLTDISGKTLKTWETPVLSTNAEFVLGDLPTGTYYLTLNIGGQFITKTIVKQ